MKEKYTRIKLEHGSARVKKGKVTPQLVASLNALVRLAYEQVEKQIKESKQP